MTRHHALPWVDVAKAVAAQLIVWHHLAFYGPMADVAWPLAPALFEALSRHARVAVQVFLVVGGFLAARHLAPQARVADAWALAPALLHRYARLVLPYGVVLVLSIGASALARQWMTHDSVSVPFTWTQWFAHIALMQDLLRMPALSAGVWYIAIDFQLFALLVLVITLTRRARSPQWAVIIVVGLMAFSLFHANRDAAWDVTAFYFFGVYGLGVLGAWWLAWDRPRAPLLAVTLLVSLALILEWRTRVAVGAACAALLVALPQGPWQPSMVKRGLAYLSRTSYSLFLVHFPVSLVVNAAFTRWVAPEPWLHACGLVIAWLTSLLAADMFHRLIEKPAVQWSAGMGVRRMD